MSTKKDRQCGNKRQYTEQAAEQVRAIAFSRRGIIVWPYQCPHCGHWHVGKRKWNMTGARRAPRT